MWRQRQRPVALVLIAGGEGLALTRDLEPVFDVRSLNVVMEPPALAAGNLDRALRVYGATRETRDRVHAETYQVFRDVPRTTSVRVIAVGHWWWAARLAAGSLVQQNFTDVQVMAFSPILSMREGYRSRDHRLVAGEWERCPGVRNVHAERLNLQPKAGLVVVYPRENETEAASLEAEPHATWLRERPGTLVVGMPTSMSCALFMLTPSVSVGPETRHAVDEETNAGRCLSNRELAFVRQLRADPSLCLEAAVERPLVWAGRVLAALGRAGSS